jgi:quinone-modifying oxidoreductase subunit QmoC
MIETVKEISFHSNFSKCSSQKSRKTAHLLIMYGFILLLLVTVYAIVAVIIHNYPLNILNPFKILGNIAALMLIVGIGIMIIQRITNKDIYGASNYFDWIFLIVLLLLTLSGIALEAGRLYNWKLAYYIYTFHLVLVWFIIIYLPYTKFGHMIYRTVAIIFSKVYSVRN